MTTPPATAYCGPPPLPADWFLRWNMDPPLLAALALLAAALAWRARQGLPRWAVAGGWGALVLAFVSPLCALTVALFAARSAHHLLVVAVAAPLLALGCPARRAPGSGALAAWALGLAAVHWLWHLPVLYDLLLRDTQAYWVMQGALLAAALGFWRAALHPHAAPLPTLAVLGATAGQMGLLGALLTLAPRPLYSAHWATTQAFGLAPLADQQLAGLIMWVVGLAPLAALAAGVGRRAWRRGLEAAA